MASIDEDDWIEVDWPLIDEATMSFGRMSEDGKGFSYDLSVPTRRRRLLKSELRRVFAESGFPDVRELRGFSSVAEAQKAVERLHGLFRREGTGDSDG